MRSHRTVRQLNSQINVVPYIDVMLVLLVIFMVTAPLIQPGEIKLPSVGQQLSNPVEPIQINLSRNGLITVTQAIPGGGAQTVKKTELVAYIKQHLNNTNRPVVIAADKQVRYDDVVQLMSVLHQAHVERIGLLATTKAQ